MCGRLGPDDRGLKSTWANLQSFAREHWEYVDQGSCSVSQRETGSPNFTAPAKSSLKIRLNVRTDVKSLNKTTSLIENVFG